MLTVADLMTPDVITVLADTDLSSAWDLLEDARIRHLPVVDEDGALIGLLSQRDLARGALGMVDELPMEEQRAVLAGKVVGELMSRAPETAAPDDDLAEAAERMLENKLGCLPVVDGETVVGILTESDFVRLYLERSDQM